MTADTPLIGITGAYGATGSVVVRTLASQRVARLLLMGRNEAKLGELAASLGGGVSVAQVDVMDQAGLERACAPCHTVINCAGPFSTVVDRVGQAALTCGAHYIDPGGDDRVFDSLNARRGEMDAKKLVFLLGAGYVPGLSEIMMRAIYDVHRGATSEACKVRLFIVDRNEWSLSGFVDIMERMANHPPEIGLYEDGVFRTKSMLTAWLRRRMPGETKSETLMPVRWYEIEQFVGEAKPARAAVYFPMEPIIYFLGRLFSYIAPNRLDLAAKIAQAAFRFKAKRQGSGGVLYTEAAGRPGKPPLQWLIDVPEGKHYSRTGQVAALAGALVVDGTIQAPGIRYLAHAVDPHDFIVRLLIWGVETIDLTEGSPNQHQPLRGKAAL